LLIIKFAKELDKPVFAGVLGPSLYLSCLIILGTVINIQLETHKFNPQLRTIYNTFNYHFLNNTDVGIYEDADNVD
jgi:hypothetical protein